MNLNSWHRWLGLISALSLIVLLVTGIGLNHTDDLGLAKRSIPASLMKWVYGVEPDRQAMQLAGLQIQRHGNQLDINESSIGLCHGRIVEAVATSDYNVVLCQKEIYLLTEEGELVEELSTAVSLNEHIHSVALDMRADNALIVKLATKSVGIDLDIASVSVLGSEWENFSWGVQEASDNASPQELITWERFFLDLHAGRIFQSSGVWLLDIIAVFLLVMIFSGMLIWYRRYKLMRELDEE